MKLSVRLVGLFLLLSITTYHCEASIWEFVRDKDFSLKSSVGCECGVCPCEIDEKKDVNRELLMEIDEGVPLKLNHSSDISNLAYGNVIVGYSQFTTEQFRKAFSHLSTLNGHVLFEGATVSVLSGVFLTNAHPKEYHHPNEILSPERIEKTVRKMRFLDKSGEFQIRAEKLVKFMGLKFYIPFTIEASWFFRPDSLWTGHEEGRLALDEMQYLTAHVRGVVVDEEEKFTHAIQIFSSAEDPYLRGAATFIISFLSPDEKYALVCFWQFVVANDLSFLRALKWIPFVESSIAEKFKMTALRDFARNVDVIRAR